MTSFSRQKFPKFEKQITYDFSEWRVLYSFVVKFQVTCIKMWKVEATCHFWVTLCPPWIGLKSMKNLVIVPSLNVNDLKSASNDAFKSYKRCMAGCMATLFFILFFYFYFFYLFIFIVIFCMATLATQPYKPLYIWRFSKGNILLNIKRIPLIFARVTKWNSCY